MSIRLHIKEKIHLSHGTEILFHLEFSIVLNNSCLRRLQTPLENRYQYFSGKDSSGLIIMGVLKFKAFMILFYYSIVLPR